MYSHSSQPSSITRGLFHVTTPPTLEQPHASVDKISPYSVVFHAGSFTFHSEFTDEKSYGVSQIRNAVRQNIVRLILHSLQYPSPNLAHFLMGYDLRKPVAKTNLQDPGKF